MLRIFGCLILILCGGGIGYLYSSKLIMRKRFLEQYLRFLNFTQVQIRYSRAPPSRILTGYEAVGGFGGFLQCCKEKLQNGQFFPLAWREAADKIKKETGLNVSDTSLLREFGEKLGTSDLEGNLKHCSLYINEVAVNLKEADEIKKQKSKLYITLGFASGMALALLLF